MWALERREVAYAFEDDEFCVGDGASEVLGVFILDELVVFGLHDGYGHADPGEVLCGVVGLGGHHDADGVSEVVELVRRGGELGVVHCVSSEAAVEEWIALVDLFKAAGVHVAAEEKCSGDAAGRSIGKDEGNAGAVTPTDEGGLFEVSRVHDGEDVGGHELVGVRASVACAAAVAAAIDENDAVAGGDEVGKLIAPVAAVSEASVQKDDGGAGAVGGVPDLGSLMFDVALGIWRCGECGSVGFEVRQIVVTEFHVCLRRFVVTGEVYRLLVVW